MVEPKVSIICPVYKAEKYINRCLDSIVAQTMTDWECILVDDGSPDNSGRICDEYEKLDSRFHVIHKKNEGVSLARKTGVEAANGMYSIHVDPDDYIECNMLEFMYKETLRQGVDVLVVDMYYEEKKGLVNLLKQTFNGSCSEDLMTDILSQKLHGSLCNKLIKHSLYRDCQLRFFPGINYCEDVLIWVQLGLFPIKVGYLNKAFYYYVRNTASITNNYTENTYKLRQNYISRLKEILNDVKYDDLIKRAELSVFYEAWCFNMYSGKQSQKEMWKYKKYLFDHHYGKRATLIFFLILIGMDTMARKLHH